MIGMGLKIFSVPSQTFRAQDVSLPDVADQVVSPPDFFGPGRLAPCLFGPGRFAPWYFGPGRFAPWDFGPRRFAPGLLDLDFSHPRRFATGPFGPGRFTPGHLGPGRFTSNILDQDVSPVGNCFIIQNICFSWNFCHLGEFTSNFSWRCFIIHMTLWHYVRDYATLLEVTLTSMRH